MTNCVILYTAQSKSSISAFTVISLASQLDIFLLYPIGYILITCFVGLVLLRNALKPFVAFLGMRGIFQLLTWIYMKCLHFHQRFRTFYETFYASKSKLFVKSSYWLFHMKGKNVWINIKFFLLTRWLLCVITFQLRRKKALG